MKKLAFTILIATTLHAADDASYTEQIRKFTTGPQFTTELVDHLPSSDRVPTPLKFLGYIAGAENHLTYAEDVYRYMRALEAASPRVKARILVFSRLPSPPQARLASRQPRPLPELQRQLSPSQAKFAQTWVIVRPPTKIPTESAIRLGDWVLVDTRDTPLHQPVRRELPVFVAVGAKPMAAVVVRFVREANRDAIAAHGPQLLDEAVVELFVPLPRQELHDGLAAGDELGPIPPGAVDRVGKRDPFRVAAVPGVLGEPDLLDRSVPVERR